MYTKKKYLALFMFASIIKVEKEPDFGLLALFGLSGKSYVLFHVYATCLKTIVVFISKSYFSLTK
jgi:hypothetical protein